MTTEKLARFAHEASTESAAFMTRREYMAFPIVATFTVDGQPVSKARARFTNYGSKSRAYTPEATKQGEKRMAAAFRAASPDWTPDGENVYGVFGIFFASTFQRRDIDNMMKLVLDSLNKVAWNDDVQVTEISAKKQVCPPGHERTEVLIYDMGPRPRNYFECVVCGNYAATYASWKGDKKFCSLSCRMAHSEQLRERTCPTCEKQFSAERTNRQKYCSKECGYEARRDDVDCLQCGVTFSIQTVHARSKNFCSSGHRTEWLRAHPVKIAKGKCQSCGAGVSRAEYTRCAACLSVGQEVVGKPHFTVTITDIGDAL